MSHCTMYFDIIFEAASGPLLKNSEEIRYAERGFLKDKYSGGQFAAKQATIRFILRKDKQNWLS